VWREGVDGGDLELQRLMLVTTANEGKRAMCVKAAGSDSGTFQRRGRSSDEAAAVVERDISSS
jgi:hypothetical protein